MESDNPIWRECYNHPIPWDTVFEPLSLPDMLAAQALEQPMAPLIDFMGRKYSYADVLSGARRVAKGLAELGIERGDRVGLFLPGLLWCLFDPRRRALHDRVADSAVVHLPKR